ncbi:short-chain dehydrogenase [Malaciobacter molluscorum LMG 25693]|uniref:Short-chain dehydrogenase n=1 Tax=Malaciobacter molluscorum LMG 25693 TaxID=870501 RepID=A0A2G1DKC9_9BACT|nr:SDR family NAD(P)-dependent oxidoreductase [Malaciobacter molluscorum]AXX91376.1 short-chain dehydrogenase/reductase [Malaciobacter molluscorum LMG 25693]PHO18874.1 short-chain dehydrogenase [Malaciobacter molluscorum LMG 25693]
MKAIVTGYSSGIGSEISKILEKNKYEVIKLKSRLNDKKSLQLEIKQILKENDINLLINCAGVGVFKPHEEIGIDKIQELIDVNLTAPIILSNLCLRSLKKTKGHIINISSIEATRHSKFSALYTATKAGLRNFSLALFEELRKTDVKVTNINPDLTKTNFFDDFNFEPSDNHNAHLTAENIAKKVFEIINFEGVITDITLRPQRLEIKKK